MNSTKEFYYKSIDFYKENAIKICNLLKHLSNFFVKDLIYIELFPNENKLLCLSNKLTIIENFLNIGTFFSDNYSNELKKIYANNKNDHLLIWTFNKNDPVSAMFKSIGMFEGFTIIKNLIIY